MFQLASDAKGRTEPYVIFQIPLSALALRELLLLGPHTFPVRPLLGPYSALASLQLLPRKFADLEKPPIHLLERCDAGVAKFEVSKQPVAMGSNFRVCGAKVQDGDIGITGDELSRGFNCESSRNQFTSIERTFAR